ncbi:MAG: adenylyltransferase/cytidyltransferase family protein, partial [Candidatus Aminicenantales bacterium]
MEIINGFDKLPSLKKKTAVTIGNFDGVHLGHQRILKFVVNEAEQYNLISLVLTFSP